jgi:hypothetical protein
VGKWRYVTTSSRPAPLDVAHLIDAGGAAGQDTGSEENPAVMMW